MDDGNFVIDGRDAALRRCVSLRIGLDVSARYSVPRFKTLSVAEANECSRGKTNAETEMPCQSGKKPDLKR